MGSNKIENLLLNSVKDNKKFDIKAVELMYSLPVNSFTLINDEMSNIYLAKLKNLKSLYLYRSKISIDGIQKLQKQLPLCKIFYRSENTPEQFD